MVLKAKPSSRKTQAKQDALREVTREGTSRLNANIPDSLYKELKIRAAQEGVSINELVVKWVKRYVSK